MNCWDSDVQHKLELIKNAPKMAFRYIDDLRQMVQGIKLGWRWEDNAMQFKRVWQEEEKLENLSITLKRAREFRKIFESVHEELKFEMETEEDFEIQTLPTLDFQCWQESGKVLYKFFIKPMAKKTLIMKRTQK